MMTATFPLTHSRTPIRPSGCPRCGSVHLSLLWDYGTSTVVVRSRCGKCRLGWEIARSSLRATLLARRLAGKLSSGGSDRYGARLREELDRELILTGLDDMTELLRRRK